MGFGYFGSKLGAGIGFGDSRCGVWFWVWRMGLRVQGMRIGVRGSRFSLEVGLMIQVFSFAVDSSLRVSETGRKEGRV